MGVQSADVPKEVEILPVVLVENFRADTAERLDDLVSDVVLRHNFVQVILN